ALAIAVAGISLWFGAQRSAAPPAMTIESALPMPEGSIVRWPAVSPDGTKVAFVGLSQDGESTLYLRELASGETTKLAFNDPGGVPTWSPDSRELLIRQSNNIVRFSPASGATQIVCHDPATMGYSWGANGDVLIATGDRIDRIAINGGATRTVVRQDSAHGELLVGWPSFLPDGTHFLYVSAHKSPDDAIYMACVASIDGRERKELVPSDTDARFANGVLLFGRSGKLMGQRFNPKTLAVSGEPKAVASELLYAFTGGSAGFSVSNNGLLVYRRGASISAASRLAWVDAGGRETGTLAPVGQFWDLSLSRDGRAVAVQVTEPQKRPHIWSFDVERGVGTILTPPTADSPNRGEATPVWSPDGRSVLYASGSTGIFEVRRKPLDGEPVTVLHNGLRNYVCDVTRDGRTAIIATSTKLGGNRFSIGALSLDSGTLTPIGPPDSSRLNAKLSPDEKWIAYVSNDTGRREVYVSAYPDARGMTRVSAHGGQMPYWSSDGTKLYYASGDLRHILVAGIRAHDGVIDVGEPRTVAGVNVKRSENTQFVVLNDGRILVNAVDADPLLNPLTLVTNWMTRVTP